LEDQDRALWNREQIAEGTRLVRQMLDSGHVNPYTVQAAIAAVHATAPSFNETDWKRIVELYDQLLELSPSPVVELNRAVAVSMSSGLVEGLALIDEILERGDLSDYYLAHSARAEFCRKLGRIEEARASYLRALELTQQAPERRFLEGRLRELRS
jgi:RNA polymerase sigma-70 factor (ECF subfamily)